MRVSQFDNSLIGTQMSDFLAGWKPFFYPGHVDSARERTRQVNWLIRKERITYPFPMVFNINGHAVCLLSQITGSKSHTSVTY